VTTRFLSHIINHIHFSSYRRKPCLKASSYSAALHTSEGSPIHIEPKPKCHKCLLNVFLNDQGFPDQSNDYNIVLHGIDGGPILWKLRHPQPDLNAPINPLYYSPFILSDKNKAKMRKDMDLLHLPPALQRKLYSIIHEHWLVFDEKGIFVPVKNYECMIDTGMAWPIAVNKILYGEHETEIM
jgi:hypothetical protein